MPVFNNLKTLGIKSEEGRGWQAVPALLRNCPHLEYLIIEVNYKPWNYLTKHLLKMLVRLNILGNLIVFFMISGSLTQCDR